jgi:hypothetical protein
LIAALVLLPAGQNDRLTNERPQQRFLKGLSLVVEFREKTAIAVLLPRNSPRSADIQTVLGNAWNKKIFGNLCYLPRYAVEETSMKRFIKAGLVAVALAASATAAFAMPRVPASAMATDGSDAVVLVKGGHGHGHGHMGRGGRGHHYGWGRGRGHHYGWSRGHHRHHH